MERSTSSCDRKAIDAHFAGRAAPAPERVMRLHLIDCARCRDYYQRHLLRARLSPRVPSPRERLAAGLGIRSRRGHVWRWLLPLPALATAAALVVLLRPAAFSPRGGQLADQSTIFVYRMEASPSHALEPGAVIHADDELAFGYRNPQRYPRLMVFAVDEHGHTYWYHPEWTDAASDPASVVIAEGAEPRELPEAVSHELDGGTLHLYALFSRQPTTVKAVEARLAAGALKPLAGERVETVELRVEASSRK
jgi:hypothetical protein